MIPGIAGAKGLVGPPLEHIGSRTIIAGLLPNTPENLERWLENPQAIVPGNAMPNMELTDDDAKDVAAYLYTLR
jgi:cytochrome c1